MKRFVALAVWLVAVNAAAGPAEAEAHYRRGATHYKNGRYREAASEFASAFSEDELPKYIYNQAQAERMAGDCASAVGSYRRFLERAPPPDQRAQAEDNIAACEASLPAVEPEPPPVPEPEPQPVIQPPPQPKFEPIPKPRPLKPIAVQPDVQPLADPLLGTGIVALGVGAGVLGWSFVVEADAEDPGTQSQRTYDEHVDALDRAENARIAGIVVMAAGGVLVAAAAVRYTLVGRSHVSVLPGAVRIRF